MGSGTHSPAGSKHIISFVQHRDTHSFRNAHSPHQQIFPQFAPQQAGPFLMPIRCGFSTSHAFRAQANAANASQPTSAHYRIPF